MSSTEEFDWIFDFVLQFLESEKFDSSVMNFVDDKCDIFDDEDENKLIYTDIHREFCDHVEALLSSNLGELGISNEMFLDSCTRARSSRDINSTVYERLVAMDDFSTFKKIMLNRNKYLEAEALQQLTEMRVANSSCKKEPVATALGSKGEKDTSDGDFKRALETASPHVMSPGASQSFSMLLPDPEELLMMKDQEFDWDAFEQLEDEDIQDFLFQSLMEMELIHRQEELEHAELERALTISLAAEETRLEALMEEIQSVRDDMNEIRQLTDAASNARSPGSDIKDSDSKGTELGPSPAKAVRDDPPSSGSSTLVDDDTSFLDSKPQDDYKPSPSSRPKKSVTHTTSGGAVDADSFSDPKPLKMKFDMKPLPGIRAPLPAIAKSNAISDLTQYAEELNEKKKVAEESVRRNQEQLSQQRKKEEEIKKQLMAGVDSDEADKRARHMREQRDRIVQKKKEEREKRVKQENEWRQKTAADDEDMINQIKDNAGGEAAVEQDSKSQEEQEAEQRRSTMRMALARRMKHSITQDKTSAKAEAKVDRVDGGGGDAGTLAELEKIGRRFEQFHEDNKKREHILEKQLERQQAQIAKNVRMSAAAMHDD